MENILDMVNQNVQNALKKFQDTKKKKRRWEYIKTKSELREDFNKHQSKTKDTIKKRDLWIKDDNTKYEREVEQRYGKSQKKRIKQKTQWKATQAD
jgi:hypothetical protein